MAIVPARRRGGHVKNRRSGLNAHAQSADNWYKHTEATPGLKKSYQIDEREFRQDSTGSYAGGSGHSSGSNPSRASQQGKYSARVSKTLYQEDEYPAAPQDLGSSEVLAHAIVRGFRMKAAKSLPKFLQRRATATGGVVEIRESRLDGNALIIAVKEVDLPRITGINGALYAGTRLAIRPYHAKNSIPESQNRSDKGTRASHTGTSGPISNVDSPRFSSDESADRSQPTDISLLASHSLASSKPDVNVKILPGLDLLAAATASNKLLQQDPKFQAKEEMPNISTSKTTLTKEDEIAIQFSETNGISLSISYLCLSQSDWDLELATEAIAFAAEFARLKGLELQASILCLDYNLWDMDNAILFVKTVVQEVSDKTGMTLDWAMECLASNEWTVNKAVEAFEDVKQLLPFEAFKKE